ncbi:MAG: T9SS type A sorting domain-containing protein, partial [Flavobacteriaceae bacterium]|nr:T9SS type A sorting domain-containing protein [Flavobacteriaceae bacterium]
RNLNTGNYDLKYHRLEFEIDPSVALITGDVTSYFIAKVNLDEITFELSDNMIVSEVKQRGNNLTYVQNSDDEVVITFPQTQNIGVLDSLTISYSGNPISSGFGSFEQSSHNGDPIIWTLSEPYGAKGWWPCKQDLNDKIDEIDVFITTPLNNNSNEEYMAVANGLEQSQVVNGNNKTTHFNHQYPIPAYLIAIAITNYEIYSHTVDNNGNPFDIVNYVYPEDLSYAQSSTGVTVDIMNLFSNLFEEYPYANEKYGHAQFGWGGGMEHTTVSFMGSFSRGLIAHELAHQWFGNKVTCGSWQDIWLNEGFATYLSGLVIEDFDGDNSFKSWRVDKVNNITSQSGGSVYVPASDTTSVSRIFNSRLSYNKGSMVLHMLRKELGDANFYQGIQDYLIEPDFSYDYAKTPGFKAIMENASGEDLTEFFNDWIYGEGYPSYQLEWNRQNPSEIRIIVNQTQSNSSVSFFEAPLPIRIYGTGGEEVDLVLDNTSNGEVFIENISFDIGLIVVDPRAHIISRNNTVVLGINENVLASEFIIFPNPAVTEFQIKKPNDLTIESIEIYDILGRKLMTPLVQESISVESLASGMHFVLFETNRGTLQRTIVKK